MHTVPWSIKAFRSPGSGVCLKNQRARLPSSYFFSLCLHSHPPYPCVFVFGGTREARSTGTEFMSTALGRLRRKRRHSATQLCARNPNRVQKVQWALPSKLKPFRIGEPKSHFATDEDNHWAVWFEFVFRFSCVGYLQTVIGGTLSRINIDITHLFGATRSVDSRSWSGTKCRSYFPTQHFSKKSRSWCGVAISCILSSIMARSYWMVSHSYNVVDLITDWIQHIRFVAWIWGLVYWDSGKFLLDHVLT